MKPHVLLFGLMLALPAAAQDDLVSWKTFAQVKMTRGQDRIVPEFSPAVASLDQKQVKVQGFMLPLDTGEKHSLFILSAASPTCAFCMPGGPDAVVEVRASRPLAYTDQPVTVSGKLWVLPSDPTGIFYRLTDAAASK